MTKGIQAKNKSPKEVVESHPLKWWLSLTVGAYVAGVISAVFLYQTFVIPSFTGRIELLTNKIQDLDIKVHETSTPSFSPTETASPTVTMTILPLSTVISQPSQSTDPTSVPTTTPSPTPSGPSVEVNIPDTGFKRFLKKTLGKVEGPITDVELRSFKSLELQSDFRVANLEGLQFCTSLQYLKITDSAGIKRIDQITGLNLLAYLELENFLELESLSALSHLDKLTYLRVESHKVTDLSPLTNLKNLSQLRIQGSPVSDLTPLKDLQNLIYLEVSGSQVIDIKPLENLPNLQTIILYGNLITDIEPLVQNKGIGLNDKVILGKNPLSEDAVKIQIEKLRDRLAEVKYEK